MTRNDTRTSNKKIELQSKYYIDLSVGMGDKWYIDYLTLCLEVTALQIERDKEIARCDHTINENKPCNCKRLTNGMLWPLLQKKIAELNLMYSAEWTAQNKPRFDFIRRANQARIAKQKWKRTKRSLT